MLLFKMQNTIHTTFTFLHTQVHVNIHFQKHVTIQNAKYYSLHYSHVVTVHLFLLKKWFLLFMYVYTCKKKIQIKKIKTTLMIFHQVSVMSWVLIVRSTCL